MYIQTIYSMNQSINQRRPLIQNEKRYYVDICTVGEDETESLGHVRRTEESDWNKQTSLSSRENEAKKYNARKKKIAKPKTPNRGTYMKGSNECGRGVSIAGEYEGINTFSIVARQVLISDL
jgi:hypothetical protein